jgi:dolichyl-phosphate beta-glucosyltransferase
MENKIHLSVIVPAYNEEKRLPKTLREIDKYLSKQSYDYEIIVVSDGSKDRTVEVAKNLMSEIKNLRVLDFEENRGKGFGVRQGMLEAKGEYRLFTDADNSTSIDQVEKMWPEFEKGYDIVIGSRDVKGAVLDPPQPLLRRFLGECFALLARIIAGTWGILDTQCGFKGFRKEAVEDIFPRCKIDRFAFDPEILISAKKLGYRIKEIPVYWKNDPESKVKFKSMVKMGIDLLKIRWNLITRKYEWKSKFQNSNVK